MLNIKCPAPWENRKKWLIKILPFLIVFMIIFGYLSFYVKFENFSAPWLFPLVFILLIIVLVVQYVSLLFSETWDIELPKNVELIDIINKEITQYLDTNKIEYEKIKAGIFKKESLTYHYYIKNRGQRLFEILVILFDTGEGTISRISIVNITDNNYREVMKIQSDIVGILNRINYQAYK